VQEHVVHEAATGRIISARFPLHWAAGSVNNVKGKAAPNLFLQCWTSTAGVVVGKEDSWSLLASIRCLGLNSVLLFYCTFRSKGCLGLVAVACLTQKQLVTQRLDSNAHRNELLVSDGIILLDDVFIPQLNVKLHTLGRYQIEAHAENVVF
jgi:hypothetical protein